MFFKERGKLLLTFEWEKLAQPQAFLVGSKKTWFSPSIRNYSGIATRELLPENCYPGIATRELL